MTVPANAQAGMTGGGDYLTELLLHYDGDNGSTIITDSSIYQKSVAANGDAALTTAVKKFGTASLDLPGTNDFLTAGSAADWKFLHNGSTPYTAECFFDPDVLSAVMFLAGTCRLGTSTGLFLAVNGSSGLQRISAGIFNGGTPNINMTTSDLAMSVDNFYHFCFEFDPDKDVNPFHATLYFQGTIVAQQDITGTLPTGNPTHTFHVGARPEDTLLDCYNGQIDEMRVRKEIVYGGAFTPPTAPFEE